MKAERALTEFRVSNEEAAEARAWETVTDAFAGSATALAPGSDATTAPRRSGATVAPRRSYSPRLAALAAGGVVVLSAVALSPAGATVGHLITRAFGVQNAIRSAGFPSPQALVTDETENRLLAVDLPSGRVARRVELPADPEDIAISRRRGVAIVVSSRAGKVTLLDSRTLRTLKTFGGFDQPHIVAVTPDGETAYVTDDVRGTLTVIGLNNTQMTSRIVVGAGAHHLTFSPDQRRAWVALGESASRIVILNTTDLRHPRLIGGFNPGFLAHDLSFSPDGQEVWVTSASGPDVAVFSVSDHRVRFRVPVGPGPQHIAFAGGVAYLTSGYGSVLERVDVRTAHVLDRAAAPYGSFELAAGDGYVVTSSLLRGTLAIYSPALKLRRVVTLAPATREVAITPR